MLAQESGIKIEHIEVLRNNPAEFEEFQQWRAENKLKQHVKFPEKRSVHPEIREKRIIESVQHAPAKEYQKRERSVRNLKNNIDARTWLKEEYTNEDGQMVCQNL